MRSGAYARTGMLAMLLWCGVSAAEAAHPLVTDDTGTQGQWKGQVEVTGELGRDRAAGTRTDSGQLATTLTLGVWETVDVFLGVPYQFETIKAAGAKDATDGVGDLTLGGKWRYWERGAWSLAVKPSFTLPTGDDGAGFGTGRVTANLVLVGTWAADPWAVHANVGYLRNENTQGDRENLWQASLAEEWHVLPRLRVVANVGAEQAHTLGSTTPLVFVLGGVIYGVTDTLDLDLGVKGGLTRPETDLTILAGLTWRF